MTESSRRIEQPQEMAGKYFVGRLSMIAEAVVGFSIKRPKTISIAAFIIAMLSALYVWQNLDVRTDMDSLLSMHLPWRQSAARLETNFLGQKDDVVLVIDGATAARANQAALSFTQSLKQHPDLFSRVYRPDSGDFFDREGLLLAPMRDVKLLTNNLISAQPLLAPLTRDPGLRGLMDSISVGLDALADDPSKAERLDKTLSLIRPQLERASSPQPQSLLWSEIFTGEPTTPDDARQIIDITPILDHSDLKPAERHTAMMRSIAAKLHLDAAHGVKVRITGSAAIDDDELETLKESVGPVGLAMASSMLLILFAALRSWKFVLPVATTMLLGATITSAVGLVLYQRFNLISMAFFPLFVGLGVDFAIQYSVRARADIHRTGAPNAGLLAASRAIGGSVSLAAMACAIGFFAFLPTNYKGVSELGTIAGAGMVIALILTLTLLPALITMLGPKGGAGTNDRGAIVKEAAPQIRYKAILAIGGLAAMYSILTLHNLRVDFDPMSLRNPASESMSTYRELARSAQTTPYTLNVLVPNLNAAKTLASRLEKAPEVGSVISLNTFLPRDQAAKIAILSDTQMLMDTTLNPWDSPPPPNDIETRNKLQEIAERLHAPEMTTRLRNASAIAAALESLAQQDAQTRAKAETALFSDFPDIIRRLNIALSPEPLQFDSLPQEIKHEWLAKNGQARIEVLPKTAPRTPEDMARFVSAVRRIAPNAAGDPITVIESQRTILSAFAIAGLLSAVAITCLLWLAFRSAYWTMMTLAPVLLSGLCTLGTCVLFGQAINLENIIAMPLLLAIGVAFNIYHIIAKRAGIAAAERSNLAKAIVFSALTTGAAFASLALSAHPGTASMGILLINALTWILLWTLFALPAALALWPHQSLQPVAA